ncbi:MAG: phosphoribosylglycinamide formyltransferase [Lentisphaerae bacterium]|nr:phosphoribosylglycinamide formyltransferase [Lentisphaerota bacterium]
MKGKILKLAILGSGSGSNFQAIADAISSKQLDAEITGVFSDVPDAFILERARRLGIYAEYLGDCIFKTRTDKNMEQLLIARLHELEADYLVLAGFMRMIKAELISTFSNAIINIHPSLLPAFPGLAAWKQALDYGVKITGCTVHYVDSGMDTGKIILQRSVPVLPDDTPETLHARIQEQEHIAYPEALRMLSRMG